MIDIKGKFEILGVAEGTIAAIFASEFEAGAAVMRRSWGNNP
jgi:hypothetical protein